ncbi:MAG: hypothetical protein A2X28_00010 [Elusimicrobia bacterium GWA2_56_46]|nr:MAG: hypothetical protein A2X28_00010 [Elusimicrobia bacterium GWA2_56_46]OGR53713.1 MAG: hypothetical protein A2X39_03080 [Elusimicrobia bacterium GWC2_56_31]HBB67652.1 hypothetical protein [Elusimicrobiota bacterium]HBW23147.1 hypothetical protein [Elusimicrobiota bacterium]
MKISMSALVLFAVLFPSLSFSAAPAGGSSPLLFSVVPYRAPKDLKGMFTPLSDYLGGKIGRPVKLVVSASLQDHIDSLGGGKVDFAFTGPAPYIKMVSKHGKMNILGRVETNGRPVFRGVIFTANNSPARDLADLEGKRFAFLDRNSTMGYLVPAYMLLKSGVALEKLGKRAFLGTQDNILMGVLAGDFDAGAVMEEIYLRYEKRGLKRLATTPEYSGHLLVAGGKLSAETAPALRAALFGLKDSAEGRAVLKSIGDGVTGIVPADDGDYDTMREVMGQLAKSGVK